MSDSVRRMVARSTLFTAILTAMWMAVVYASQVVLAAWFGAGKEMDAYLAATSVPLLISTLTVESLNLAFVPVFIEHQLHGDEQAAWRITSIVLSTLILALTLLSAAGVLFSPLLMRVIVPGFDPPRYALATTMSQIIFPSVLFTSVAGFLNSMNYAQRRFLIPALSPLVAAIVNLGLILAFARNLGIVASAWGSFWGPVASCVLAAPILREHQVRFDLNWRDAGMREIAQLAGWRLLGEMFGKATPIFERFIASGLAVGSISYLGYASRIVSLALGLIVQSTSTVLFPFLSERAVSAQSDPAAMGRAVSVGLRMTALIALPISALFMALSMPIVQLLFQRGQFDAQATRAVALAVIAYFGLWLSNSLAAPVVPALYALKQMRLLALVEPLGVVVYLAGALTLTRVFDYLGLALALSLNFVFNTLLYAYFLFVHQRVPFDMQIVQFYCKCIPATVAGVAVAWLTYPLLVTMIRLEQFGGIARTILNVSLLAGLSVLALAIYVSVLSVLRAKEIAILWDAVSRRRVADIK